MPEVLIIVPPTSCAEVLRAEVDHALRSIRPREFADCACQRRRAHATALKYLDAQLACPIAEVRARFLAENKPVINNLLERMVARFRTLEAFFDSSPRGHGPGDLPGFLAALPKDHWLEEDAAIGVSNPLLDLWADRVGQQVEAAVVRELCLPLDLPDPSCAACRGTGSDPMPDSASPVMDWVSYGIVEGTHRSLPAVLEHLPESLVLPSHACLERRFPPAWRSVCVFRPGAMWRALVASQLSQWPGYWSVTVDYD